MVEETYRIYGPQTPAFRRESGVGVSWEGGEGGEDGGAGGMAGGAAWRGFRL